MNLACNFADRLFVSGTYFPENLNVTKDPLDAFTELGRYWKGPPEVEATPPNSICRVGEQA